ncbi:hypothetical protein VIGAN_02208200, partial [Vigna angularis var. angularis]
MVRELLEMVRSKKACIVFFDGVGGDNEVQRTTLEIVNQLDGFDARGNIKVLMATNRLVRFISRASQDYCASFVIIMMHSNDMCTILRTLNSNQLIYSTFN